ncbi:MAG: hypothetical protein K5657_07385 [Desulfovibrio sp.]|nr:hypothetical protein [Desulfovibrio sp.]
MRLRGFCLLSLILIAFLSQPLFVVESSAAHTNYVDTLTGELWLKSSVEEKRAFLFGVDSAVTVEHVVYQTLKERAAKKGKKSRARLSPFVNGWMKAFQEMPRNELVKSIDAWYEAHPDKVSEPVMKIIWYEIICKRLPSGNK